MWCGASSGGVYEQLGIPVTTTDPMTMTVGNLGYEARRIDGVRMNAYVDCGNSPAGPVANQYAVTLSVMTKLAKVGESRTEVSTVVDASAKSRSMAGYPGPVYDPRKAGGTGHQEGGGSPRGRGPDLSAGHEARDLPLARLGARGVATERRGTGTAGDRSPGSVRDRAPGTDTWRLHPGDQARVLDRAATQEPNQSLRNERNHP